VAERERDRIGEFAGYVTRVRHDPERLAALKRAVSGKTRCTECDAVNPANQIHCDKCGAKLYPDLPDEDEEK
jgi:ribosomal protein L40E